MTKRLLLLGGIATFAVILHHAAGYGQIALYLWANTYLPVTVPYWEALDSVSHYGLLIAKSFGAPAVPAFLFVSGFFSVYIARSNRSTGSPWVAVYKRISGLLVPYVIWSAIAFTLDALQGTVYGPVQYVTKLLTTGAAGYLYYVPLLCECYLLSPWIIAAAKKRPRLLMMILVVLQLGAVGARYLARSGVQSEALTWAVRLTPAWSLPRWLSFFAIGAIVALNTQKTRAVLERYRWGILGLVVLAWMANILEGDTLLRTYRTYWSANVDTFSYHLLASSAIACFFAFDRVALPMSGALSTLGKRAYGLYLVHAPVIDLAARIIRRVAPAVLAHQVLLVASLLLVGLGVPLLVMEGADRLPSTRRVYRYLFG